MRTLAWPCPAPGGSGEEFALVAGPIEAASRVLIVPALFEEANRTRRLLAETLRALAGKGIAGVLPDLPGCNESVAPLESQDLASWRGAMAAAAAHFAVSHVLAVRGGAAIAPDCHDGWSFEPIGGAIALRQLLRARMIAAREAGRDEPLDGLLSEGRERGIELAGYVLGPAMVRDLAADPPRSDRWRSRIAVSELGGAPLWLRSEPGEDPAQAAALAARVTADLAG